jgi:hypothetical protein
MNPRFFENSPPRCQARSVRRRRTQTLARTRSGKWREAERKLLSKEGELGGDEPSSQEPDGCRREGPRSIEPGRIGSTRCPGQPNNLWTRGGSGVGGEGSGRGSSGGSGGAGVGAAKGSSPPPFGGFKTPKETMSRGSHGPGRVGDVEQPFTQTTA